MTRRKEVLILCIAFIVSIGFFSFLVKQGIKRDEIQQRELFSTLTRNNANNLSRATSSTGTAPQSAIITVCMSNTSHAQTQIQSAICLGFNFKLVIVFSRNPSRK